MTSSPYLARIDIYPVKSLDGVSVSQADIAPGGALQGDRTFALLDAEGEFVNGKRNRRVHQLRSHFSDDGLQITLAVQDSPETATFALQVPAPELEAWLSDYFQQSVTVRENRHWGFPDDTVSPGPTVISTATLEIVTAWYKDLTVEEVRRRFRANLEIGGVPPFWEDQLFGEAGETVVFQVGDVTLWGVNPCQRCIVPSRDTVTGEATAGFQKTFSQQRQTTLPPQVNRSRFNHFYRLAVNTRLPATEAGKGVRVGDRVVRL